MLNFCEENIMADSLKTIDANIKKQVKLLEIANENKTVRKKEKYELVTHLKHAETPLEILQDLKYEGQEEWLLVMRMMKP